MQTEEVEAAVTRYFVQLFVSKFENLEAVGSF